MGFDYSFGDRTYESDRAFDSRRHTGGVSYDRSIGRTSGIRASYRYSHVDSFDAVGNFLPLADHVAELGIRYGRNLTPSRGIQLSAGAGAVYVQTDVSAPQPDRAWDPSGYGSLSVDLPRGWTLSTRYQRAVSILQGFAPEPYLTDSFNVGLGGMLASRVQLAVAGAYANGQTGGSPEVAERFERLSITNQLMLLITEEWSVVVSYSHYRHTLSPVTQ